MLKHDIRYKKLHEQIKKIEEAIIPHSICKPVTKNEIIREMLKDIIINKKLGLYPEKIYIYPTLFDEHMRSRIKERDNYTCQECKSKEKIKLCVHRIDYNKTNLEEGNLITLCKSCNSKSNGDRKYWENHFREVIYRLHRC